jgi:hypothetical protein
MGKTQDKAYDATLYRARVFKGVCVFHPSVKISKGTYCDRCKSDRQIIASKLKGLGKCVQCRKLNVKDGCTLCPMCLKKAALAIQPYRQKCTEVNPDWATMRGWRADKLAHCAVLRRLGSKCVCCGETHPLFLSIDHIDGGGSKHRKALGSKGLIRKLVKQKDLSAYRILCIICNWGRQRNRGICPHKTSPKLTVGVMISNLQKVGYTNASWDDLLYM